MRWDSRPSSCTRSDTSFTRSRMRSMPCTAARTASPPACAVCRSPSASSATSSAAAATSASDGGHLLDQGVDFLHLLGLVLGTRGDLVNGFAQLVGGFRGRVGVGSLLHRAVGHLVDGGHDLRHGFRRRLRHLPQRPAAFHQLRAGFPDGQHHRPEFLHHAVEGVGHVAYFVPGLDLKRLQGQVPLGQAVGRLGHRPGRPRHAAGDGDGRHGADNQGHHRKGP